MFLNKERNEIDLMKLLEWIAPLVSQFKEDDCEILGRVENNILSIYITSKEYYYSMGVNDVRIDDNVWEFKYICRRR